MENPTDSPNPSRPVDEIREQLREHLAEARLQIDRIGEIREAQIRSERGESTLRDWRVAFDTAGERYDEATVAFQEAVERRKALAECHQGVFSRLIDRIRSR